MVGALSHALLLDLFQTYDLKVEGILRKEQALDILCTLHGSITDTQAMDFYEQIDRTGRQILSFPEFESFLNLACASFALDVTHDAIRALSRTKRNAYRIKYLMYDPERHTLPASIVENPTTMKLYREIFAGANGTPAERVKKEDIRWLLLECCGMSRLHEVMDLVRAMHIVGDGEVEFLEFVVCLSGARLSLSLTDLALKAKSYSGVRGTGWRQHGRNAPSKQNQDVLEMERLRSEVQQYQRLNNESDRRMQKSLYTLDTEQDGGYAEDVTDPHSEDYGVRRLQLSPAAKDVARAPAAVYPRPKTVDTGTKIGSLPENVSGMPRGRLDLPGESGVMHTKTELHTREQEVAVPSFPTSHIGNALQESTMGDSTSLCNDANHRRMVQEIQRLRALIEMQKETNYWRLLNIQGGEDTQSSILTDTTHGELRMRHRHLRDVIQGTPVQDIVGSPGGMTIVDTFLNEYEHLVQSYEHKYKAMREMVHAMDYKNTLGWTSGQDSQPRQEPAEIETLLRSSRTESRARTSRTHATPSTSGWKSLSMRTPRFNTSTRDPPSIREPPSSYRANGALLTPDERSQLRLLRRSTGTQASRVPAPGSTLQTRARSPIVPSRDSSYGVLQRLADLRSVRDARCLRSVAW